MGVNGNNNLWCVPCMANSEVTTMTNDDNENTKSKHPWVWQKTLLAHYSGQDTVLSNCMT